jgi:hypothetical protein
VGTEASVSAGPPLHVSTRVDGGTPLQWLWWQLGQRLSVNVGITLTERAPEATGSFTGIVGSKWGLVGAGIRLTEFLKINGGVLLATYRGGDAGSSRKLFAPSFLGISLDLPVYRVVGKALTPTIPEQLAEPKEAKP